MKVAIIGSRNFCDRAYFDKMMENHKDITYIYSGGNRTLKYRKGIPYYIGADYFAEEHAKKKELPITIFHAEWKKYGKSAGFLRNKLIINDCDFVIAFWDKKSKGTANSIELAQKKKKNVVIYSEGFFYKEPNDKKDKTEDDLYLSVSDLLSLNEKLGLEI
jgi:hypothetical protein